MDAPSYHFSPRSPEVDLRRGPWTAPNRLAVSGMVAFLAVLAACMTPPQRMTAADLEGQIFTKSQEIIQWSGCQQFVGAYDSMPSTLDDRDALPLATSFANDPTFGIDVEVTAVVKVGPDVWAIVGADDLVVGAMQARQQVVFCTD